MKTTVFTLALLLISTTTIWGQTGVEDGSKYGKGEDSIRCLEKLYLYKMYLKQKNMEESFRHWEIAYNECPASSRSLYSHGSQLLGWKISQAKTPEEKKARINELMDLYDKRIKYFGDDKKYPVGYILERKAIDLIRYRPDEVKEIYSIYDNLLTTRKDQMPVGVFKNIMAYTVRYYDQGGISMADALDRYGIISEELKKRGDTEVQTDVDNMVAAIANCENLINIYSKQLEENRDNLEWLEKSLRFLSRANCKEDPFYFQLAEIKHKAAPSTESALGMARRYFNNQDFNKGLAFYLEAVELEQDPKEKANYLFMIAQVTYSKLNNAVKARQQCLEALKYNPNWGEPYILIAQMYSTTAAKGQLGKEDIQNRAGYWAAYDKAMRAKQVDSDPQVAQKANSLMSQYKKQFPKKAEVFMHPDYKEGAKITVGGWIQEKTTVRSTD